jgi:hypothetical protein
MNRDETIGVVSDGNVSVVVSKDRGQMTTAKGPLQYFSKTGKHFVLAKFSCEEPLTLPAARLV